MQPKLKFLVGPSILNSDLANLTDECRRLLKAGGDYLHLDVMDGRFVPNLTFGHPVVKCLRKSLPKPVFFDMHMMVDEPEKWVSSMADAGADLYTFHLEATQNPGSLVRKIKEAGMQVGMALKPGTSIDGLLEFGDMIDVALIMTVEPGFGGQAFMDDMMPKVKEIRQHFPHLNVEVDGGVGPSNVRLCAESGANMIVSGTAITASKDPHHIINDMKNNCLKFFNP